MSDRKCNKCGGTGTLFNPQCTSPNSPCWNCGGTGYTPKMTTACTGCITKDKTINQLLVDNANLILDNEQLKARLDAVNRTKDEWRHHVVTDLDHSFWNAINLCTEAIDKALQATND